VVQDIAGDGRGLVVFVPGTWVRARCWSAWQDHFDRNGYDSLISGWPGEIAGTDRVPDPRTPTRVSLNTLVDRLDVVLAGTGPGPILIGHGIGAVVVQILVGRGRVAGAAIAIAPPTVGWVRRAAALGNLAAGLRCGVLEVMRPGTLSPRTFALAYANTCPPDEAAELYRRFVIPSTIRPLVRASVTWRDPGSRAKPAGRAPTLLISAGRDRLCPERAVIGWERFGRRHFPDDVTDHHVFPRRGHSLTFDAGWRAVADYCLDWLSAHDM
jgi:non-heme chloroperoxidase